MRKQRGFALLEGLLILVIVGLVGGTGWYVLHTKAKLYNSSTGTSSSGTTLRVESDPAGIDVTGSPLCDSKKLKKTTPYDCTQNSSGITTVLTAQETVTVNGQAYKFKTWDGCSESNADKKICKVKVDQGKVKAVKAVYQAGSEPSSGSSSNDHKVASDQCKNSLKLDNDFNYSCNVTVRGQLLGLNLVPLNGSFQKEPPLTVTCSTTCDLLPANTPTAINSNKSYINVGSYTGPRPNDKDVLTTITIKFPELVQIWNNMSTGDQTREEFYSIQENNASSNNYEDDKRGGRYGWYSITIYYNINHLTGSH